MKRLTLTIILLFTASAALADVALYLYPSVIAEGSQVRLSSIASIDAGQKDGELAASIIIPAFMYSDGFIDKRELLAFASSYFNGPVSVFGSAVKINFLQKKNEPAPWQGIARGKMVKVVCTSGAIKIELRGKALKSGMPGETISVRVNRRIIRAVVIDGEKVEKQL